MPRVDVPDKITGKYTYVHNVRIPGMLHGRVVRPRGQGPFGTGAPIVSVDESSIKHIPGARVLRQGDFLGVVAAERVRRDPGRRAAQGDLEGEPDAADLGQPLQADAGRRQRRLAKAAFRTNTGNVDTALKLGGDRRSRRPTAYHYGGRAVIGPSCAVADVRANSATIYQSSQNLLGDGDGGLAAARASRPQNVRAYYYEGASSYGSGQSASESSKAAALMSKLAGAPVRMQLMRWDEHGWDYFQAAQLIDVRARHRRERQAHRVRLHAACSSRTRRAST